MRGASRFLSAAAANMSRPDREDPMAQQDIDPEIRDRALNFVKPDPDQEDEAWDAWTREVEEGLRRPVAFAHMLAECSTLEQLVDSLRETTEWLGERAEDGWELDGKVQDGYAEIISPDLQDELPA